MRYHTIGDSVFFSEWAFAHNGREFFKHNLEALKGYEGRYIKAQPGEIEQVCEDNPHSMVYHEGPATLSTQTYIIDQNPEHLTVDELALIVDGGNLCFGFRGDINRVIIYTD